MKKIHSAPFSRLLFIGISLLVSCSPKGITNQPVSGKGKAANPIEVKAEAESFTGSDGQIEVKTTESNVVYVNAASGGWIALEVNIPVAGRYQAQIQLSSETGQSLNCWIEDYYDNKDERTYNITGNMSVPAPSSAFAVSSKDGSPLNAGLHKMKVHFDNQVNIDWVNFKLMKARVETPATMTQNTDGAAWKVVWADEFDGPVVDTTKWTYDIGNWGWGNNELQYYTRDRAENARIEDGNLIIEARKDDMGEKWTSAYLLIVG